MKRYITYRCDYCDSEFSQRAACLKHEKACARSCNTCQHKKGPDGTHVRLANWGWCRNGHRKPFACGDTIPETFRTDCPDWESDNE